MQVQVTIPVISGLREDGFGEPGAKFMAVRLADVPERFRDGLRALSIKVTSQIDERRGVFKIKNEGDCVIVGNAITFFLSKGNLVKNRLGNKPNERYLIINN
jgi:hypothetical protein